jgi:alpha-tubulin suppressor-like RCC1 family protein
VTPTPTATPTPLYGVMQIAAGGSHSCALLNTGGITCWGSNDHGQVGDGTSGTTRPAPVAVSGLNSDVLQVSGGGGHTCALLSAGSVKCWGPSSFVGNGISGVDQLSPVDVSGLSSGVTQIAGGDRHTCALLSTGGVKCWGANDYGQIGDGTSGTTRLTPVDVSGLTSGVAQITAGGNHTCALLSTGGVLCWGYNFDGQIGDGTKGATPYVGNRFSPVGVSGLTSGVLQVAAAYEHTCALLSTGGVKCWGANFYGQLGDGTSAANRLTPVDVSGLTSGVTQIAAGMGRHSCALLSSGGVQCWGYNHAGQIGDGTSGYGVSVSKLAPVNVSNLSSGVTQITTGYSHTCARLNTGGVKCWGYNNFGQIGNGYSGGYYMSPITPVEVRGS